MIRRSIEVKIQAFSKFPAVAILGPRQSGKTTLAKKVFPQHRYLNFEDEAMRTSALEDPKRFLSIHDNEFGIILDEFQQVPKLLSYIQLNIDEHDRPGYFVLTGSQNFLMNQAITQSLAGRVGIINLHPFSMQELKENNLLLESTDRVILNGFYPRIYDKNINPALFYPGYIQSYIERDVRQILNVGDLHLFQNFVALCAGRIGQLVNMEALGNACGITGKTVKAWLSILEASYIIFLVKPHHKNFNKRVVKTPKLYFYDTGLACSLLRITTLDACIFHPLRPALFENLIIADLYKQFCNRGERPPLYFWRDANGTYEIDCIIDQGDKLIPVEIKSGETITTDFFRGLTSWNEMDQADPSKSLIVYGGDIKHARKQGTVIGWRHAVDLISKI